MEAKFLSRKEKADGHVHASQLREIVPPSTGIDSIPVRQGTPTLAVPICVFPQIFLRSMPAGNGLRSRYFDTLAANCAIKAPDRTRTVGRKRDGPDLGSNFVRPTYTRAPVRLHGPSDGAAHLPCCRARCNCGVSYRRRIAGTIFATDVSAMGRKISPTCAGSRHIRTDLQPGDGGHQARHCGLRAVALTAGIRRADV